MSKKKIAWLLCIVVAVSLFSSACALFGGDDDPLPEPGEIEMPEFKKRVYWSPGDKFINNVRDSEKGLSQVTVSLLFSKDMAADLDLNAPAIRNIISKIIMEKDEAYLRDPNVIEKLEDEMTDALWEFLQMEEFVRVYISDFLVQ